jgi:hypothetical protein
MLMRSGDYEAGISGGRLKMTQLFRRKSPCMTLNS